MITADSAGEILALLIRVERRARRVEVVSGKRLLEIEGSFEVLKFLTETRVLSNLHFGGVTLIQHDGFWLYEARLYFGERCIFLGQYKAVGRLSLLVYLH